MVYKGKAEIVKSADNPIVSSIGKFIRPLIIRLLNYDEIDPAYEFESDGPQQSMTQMGMGKRPYEFVSKGPSDVYEDEDYFEDADFDALLNYDEDLQHKRDQIEENVNKSLDMFRRFKGFN